jgi:hypothetical protein
VKKGLLDNVWMLCPMWILYEGSCGCVGGGCVVHKSQGTRDRKEVALRPVPKKRIERRLC